MIYVIPKFIGEGIPLIAPDRRTVPLKLISCTKFTNDVVKLHYAVRSNLHAQEPVRNAGDFGSVKLE